jgi:hypothetical protein
MGGGSFATGLCPLQIGGSNDGRTGHEVFTLPLVFQSDSNQTARTPRTVLGLSSDYFWLRGLLNIQCESEPVRTESKQSPSDYSESSDSPRTRLRTESEQSPTSLARIQLNSYFNLKSNYYHDSNPRPPGLMKNKWHY